MGLPGCALRQKSPPGLRAPDVVQGKGKLDFLEIALG